MKSKIYAFDFDGTLTNRDTLLEFIRFAKGTFSLLCGLFVYCPKLILMLLHLYPNWKVKQQFFAHYFKGMNIENFNHICKDFANAKRQSIMRQEGVKTLKEADNSGCKIIIISASIENWIKPFFESFKNIVIIGTKIEVKDGIITGRFLTPNCYGAEKVRRIKKALPSKKDYHLIAYGDSRGDKELLEYADERHYKPFR